MVLPSGRRPARRIVYHWLTGTCASALLVAGLSNQRAEAACTPSAPVSNTTVTCTGTTTNANGTNGYGTNADTGNIYNIGTSATVEGTLYGLALHDGAINNDGTIAGQTGIFASSLGSTISLVLNNAGTISGYGVAGGAVLSNAPANVTNSGLITGARAGVDIGSNLGKSFVTNSGTITGGLFGVYSSGDIDIVTSGVISATGVLAAGVRSRGNLALSNSGTIVGTSSGAEGLTAALTNSGTISGGNFGILADLVAITNLAGGKVRATATDGIAIRAETSAALLNEGEILASGSNGVAILAKNMGATNSGIISGAWQAISGDDFTLFNLAGGYVSGDTALSAINSVTVENAGTIKGGAKGITGDVVDIWNSGVISASANNGRAVDANLSANVWNSGTIAGDDGFGVIGAKLSIANAKDGMISGAVAVYSADSVVRNDGTLRGVGNASKGLYAINTVELTNTGTITAGSYGVQTPGHAAVLNSGVIAGAQPGGIGIDTKTLDLVNAGTISGFYGIRATGAANITNSGAISGNIEAIKLSNANDTLTLLSGSRINGVVDMGFGTGDVVNASVIAPHTRISSLTSVTLPTLVNFEGTLNVNVSSGGFNGPSVISGTQIATLDPTALAQADRALLDVSGGVSSLVQGRLNGTASAGNGMTAMAYAAEDARGPFAKIATRNVWTDPASVTVWTNSFGGRRQQDESAVTLASTTTSWGGAIGIDRRLRPDWLVGAFVGGGAGSVSVALGSQTVDTDYVFAGGYSRFAWDTQFIDVTLQGGNASNKSRRLVLVDGGAQTATASYDGWYISPEIAYGRRFDIGNGYVLTPTARLRYLAGLFNGYSEAGSAQGLGIGSRTLQNFEERGELDISRVTHVFGGDHVLKTNLHAGVVAIQRAGNPVINAVLIGQNLSFATPGSGSTVGAVAGAGFDYRTSRNVAVFGAVEGLMMSDSSRVATAKGGVRVAF